MASEVAERGPRRRNDWQRRALRAWRRTRRRWRRQPSWLRSVVGFILALALLWVVVWVVQRPTALERAGDECRAVLQVGDDGHTMSLEVAEKPGDNVFAWVDFDKFRCITDELEVPSFVMTHIGQTRALDGQQTDSWDEMSARWTYHPNSGLIITFRED